MATEVAAMDEPSKRSTALRSAATAAAFTVAASRPALARRWSRKLVQSTPPPLPLISLPPDDDWEEFDVPVKTGFSYSLPHVTLEREEMEDESATIPPVARAGQTKQFPLHDRAAICRMLSEYMAQNETFQMRRHGFGVDTNLVYKRTKCNTRRGTPVPSSLLDGGTDCSGLDDLAFNSFFESGNLDRAYRILGRHYATTQELLGTASSATSTPTPSATTSQAPWSTPFPFFVKADMEYDLYCDTDISTHGHIQWYFFRTTVPQSCFKKSDSGVLRVRFNIRNMLKKSSLYNEGMLPAIYIDSKHGRGWHHAGSNVCYFKNGDTYRHRKSGKITNFYTLSFVYDFKLPAGADLTPLSVFFAHSYPYTFSRLQKFLLDLQKDPDRNRYFRRRVLCKTIAGNICDVLTITDFGQEDDARSGVILTARVHPGESNASYIMHGILDFLTGPTLEARFLRHRFVFKIVPMLNPDGVIHGNYRCSLAGTDLNRRYVEPSQELHPTVYATKNMILSMKKTRPVSLYCDIHGHSRKKNMFLYGCLPYEENSRAEAAKIRLFPHVLSKTCCAGDGGYFSFADCTFSVSKSKRGTGRVVVWDEAQVPNSFTLEASFFGVGVNRKRGNHGPLLPTNQHASLDNTRTTKVPLESAMLHFMPHDLRAAGVKFCLALIPFSQLLDRDRPSAPPAQSCVSEDEPTALPVRAFVASADSELAEGTLRTTTARPYTAVSPVDRLTRQHGDTISSLDTKIRLAPLHSTSNSYPQPRLATRIALQPLSSTEWPTSSPRTSELTTSIEHLFSIDGMLSSLVSTDDLLREIEDTLPENYSQCGDSDDEGDSVGSESDPSGDNMEAEELQRQDSWSELIPGGAVQTPESVPKLTKNRSQSLLKRFSDSMLKSALETNEPQPNEPSHEQRTQLPVPEAVTTPAPQPSREPAKVKPVATLAPVKTSAQPTTYMLRKNPVTRQQFTSSHPHDRNKDIAGLHLRAVQRRTRARRRSQRITVNEQEPI